MNAPEDGVAVRPASVRELAEALRRGEDGAFDQLLIEIERQQRDCDLVANVARVTRDLRDGLSELCLQGRLARVAGNDMPDAVSRLDYVVTMTENAAHRTLDLVEDGRAIADDFAAVHQHLQRLYTQDAASSLELRQAARAVVDGESRLRATLTALSQAQEYQDLSGQLIRRVIALVRNAEAALLDLLGEERVQSARALPISHQQAALPGPAVPQIDADAADQGDADRLLASLGF